MSIYSANRTGSFNVAQIPANESYKWNDIGRILCESQANDMAFFEAALACDFTEVKGLREGAIAKRDVELASVENKKKFIERMIERVKSFWAKLKGAIKSAINKIAELALSSKEFVAHFDKVVTAKALSDWKGSISGIITYDHSNIHLSNVDFSVFSTETSNISDCLGKTIGNASDVTPKNYTSKAMEYCKSVETLTSAGVKEYKDIVSTASDRIKYLKQYEKNFENTMNNMINELKRSATTELKKAAANVVAERVQNTEIICSITTKAAITMIKEDMKSRRTALRKVMDDIAKTGSEVHEAAVLDDMEAFEDTINAGLPDEETKKEIDALVASV